MKNKILLEIKFIKLKRNLRTFLKKHITLIVLIISSCFISFCLIYLFYVFSNQNKLWFSYNGSSRSIICNNFKGSLEITSCYLSNANYHGENNKLYPGSINFSGWNITVPNKFLFVDENNNNELMEFDDLSKAKIVYYGFISIMQDDETKYVPLCLADQIFDISIMEYDPAPNFSPENVNKYMVNGSRYGLIDKDLYGAFDKNTRIESLELEFYYDNKLVKTAKKIIFQNDLDLSFRFDNNHKADVDIEKAFIDGTCTSYSSGSAVIGKLNLLQQNEVKEMNIEGFPFSAKSKSVDKLHVNYFSDYYTSNLKLFGPVSILTIADSNIVMDFEQWAIKNSVLILTLILAFNSIMATALSAFEKHKSDK